MAAYETALPGMKGFVSNSKYLNGLKIPQYPNIEKLDWNLALNEAYYTTHSHFMFNLTSSQKDYILNKYNQILKTYSNLQSQEIIDNSRIWGLAVAEAIIAYSITDTEAEKQILNPRPLDYEAPVGPGKWKPTAPDYSGALFPYWGKVRTFATFNNDLLSLPPVSYSQDSESAYFKEFKEVDDVVKNLSNKDRWIAEFWSDDLTGLTFSPPARQFAIANQLIDQQNLNLESSIHLYVKLGLALNDAAVAAWQSKYIYNIERPDNFIKEHINPNFKTILGDAIGVSGLTPSFPGYPSGHSTFASAGAGVFIDFFGNNFSFVDNCHKGRTEFNGKPRVFLKFSEMAAENAFSRIPLGVHPRMDCVEGLRLGYVVSDRVNAYKLKVE
jgi:membrane-associated phospholipid phosphatase